MKVIKTIAGVVSISALMLFAMLAGSVLLRTAGAGAPIGQTNLAAQSAQQAQATATAVPATPAPGTPKQGLPPGPGGRGRGGHGPGPGFGPGMGHHGAQLTAEGASRVISVTTEFIALVKSDLAYATGKMDTATVQDWVNKADGLVRTAQTASASSQYGRAIATANAARELAGAADIVMQQALEADQLPSYNQRPLRGKGRFGPGGPDMPGTTITPTQAQASRELAGLYNSIVAKDALLKTVSNAGDAGTYLTAAKNSYRTAYTAYQAGNYTDAHKAAVVAHSLLHVVDSLMHAATAPNSPDTPVTVPQPNF